jgi:hypothetical protein
MVAPRTRRGEVAKGAMPPRRVVEVDDVASHSRGQLRVGQPPRCAVEKFDLQGPPKEIHGGIVETAANGSHRATQRVTFQTPGNRLREKLGELNRSLCGMVSEVKARNLAAMVRGWLTKVASLFLFIAQPTTRREYGSSSAQQ